MNSHFIINLTKCICFSFRKAVLFILIISIFLTPVVTQAGVISFISDISDFFSGQEASAQGISVIESNSQSMTLLESPTNVDPSIDDCEETIVVDGEEALLSPSIPSLSTVCEKGGSGSSIISYIVREGDTYSKIAGMFNVSINTILWYNNLSKSSTLKVGQTLYVLPIDGVMYTVKKGDTLSTIAKDHKGDINEIASYNNLKVTDAIIPGDTIMIPNGEEATVDISVTKSSGSKSSVAGGQVNNGYFVKPFLVGRKTQGIHGRNGVDFGMPVGSPLYAAAAGTVVTSKGSGWNGGYGNYVVIKHSNGTQTWYAHMSSQTVSVGQFVNQGQLIGYSGNSGKSTGPHLHFEVRGAKNPF